MSTLKILTGLCLIKQDIKAKKYFCKSYLQFFSNDKVLIKHKKDVKLEKGFISFKNYSKQIPVPFKTYADFECILKNVNDVGIDNECCSYTKKFLKNMVIVGQ